MPRTKSPKSEGPGKNYFRFELEPDLDNILNQRAESAGLTRRQYNAVVRQQVIAYVRQSDVENEEASVDLLADDFVFVTARAEREKISPTKVIHNLIAAFRRHVATGR